jgi:N-acylglucosamine 2-epimerase
MNSSELANFYRTTLLDDVMPFCLRHGLDREQGGILTALNFERHGGILRVT